MGIPRKLPIRAISHKDMEKSTDGRRGCVPDYFYHQTPTGHKANRIYLVYLPSMIQTVSVVLVQKGLELLTDRLLPDASDVVAGLISNLLSDVFPALAKGSSERRSWEEVVSLSALQGFGQALETYIQINEGDRSLLQRGMQFIGLAKSNPATEEARRLKSFIDSECRLFSQSPGDALWLSMDSTEKLNLATAEDGSMKELARQLYTLLEKRRQEREKEAVHLSEGLKDFLIENWYSHFQKAFGYNIARNPHLQTFLHTHLLRPLEERLGNVQNLQERFQALLVEWLQKNDFVLQEIQLSLEEIKKILHDHQRKAQGTLWGRSPSIFKLVSSTNKFIEEAYSRPFFGRQELLKSVYEWIRSERNGKAILYGPAGYGKSAFMVRLAVLLKNDPQIRVAYHFFRRDSLIGDRGLDPANAWAHLLAQIEELIPQEWKQEQPPADAAGRLDWIDYTLATAALSEDERLVILIDGLDEVGLKASELPGSLDLAPGVFLIYSGRWEGKGPLPFYFDGIASVAQHFPLHLLTRTDIQDWIANTDALKAYAADWQLIDMLYEKTEGRPLYVKHLLEDLSQARESQQLYALLQATPKGLHAYLIQQFHDLYKQLSADQQRMLGFLCIAHGALSQRELLQLTRLPAAELQCLPAAMRRWLKVEGETDPLYAFTHLYVKEVFREGYGEAFLKLWEDELVAWALRWREHKSPYALRYLPQHLYQRGEVEQLWALIEGGEFMAAQERELREEPERIQELFQLGLQAAVEREKPEIMIRVLGAYHKYISDFAQRLIAVGASEQGLRLAGLLWEKDAHWATIAHLYIAAEAVIKGNKDIAQRAVKAIQNRLESHPITEMKHECGAAAACFLSVCGSIEGIGKVASMVLGESEYEEQVLDMWLKHYELNSAMEIFRYGNHLPRDAKNTLSLAITKHISQ
ncbi:MAG: NACHT domain-containing protein, partial [Bacteroidia bacterium]|nr:NACHT domain-containing protein [Bacteroidia bacterium]